MYIYFNGEANLAPLQQSRLWNMWQEILIKIYYE